MALKTFRRYQSLPCVVHKVDVLVPSIAEKTANYDSDKECLYAESDDGLKRWHP